MLKKLLLAAGLIMLVILVVILSSCNDNPVIPEMANSYFPIQMGNSWTFEFTYYDSVQQHTEVTYTINRKSVIDGKKYFAFDTWPEFIQIPWEFSSVDEIYIRNDENGNVMMRFKEKEFMFIKFDSSLKDTMINIVTLYHEIFKSNIIYRSKIFDTNISMQTETQNFNNGFNITFFRAVDYDLDAVFFPGFGMVKMDYPSEGKIWKLKQAIINGKKTERILSITYPNY